MTLKNILTFTTITCMTVCLGGQSQPLRSASHPGTVVMFGPSGSALLDACTDIGKIKVGDKVPQTKLAINAKHVGLCEGYLAGVNDATMTAVALGAKAPYCLPDGFQMTELIRVVQKSLKENPTQLQLTSGVLVSKALKDAFPCR